MVLPVAAKLALVAVPAIVGLVALSSKDAHAATPSKALPPELIRKVEAALKTADPTVIHAVADEVEAAGFKEQADSLDAAADAIEQAENSVDPTHVVNSSGPVLTVPGATVPSDGGPPVVTGRVLIVKKGQGPFQVAQDALGASAGAARWPELRDANLPKSADGIPRKWAKDPKTNQYGFVPALNPGDKLLVPPSWPTTPAMKVDTIISGDDEIGGDDLRKLAGRVALEVASKPKGKENRELVAALQRAEHARGRYGGRSHGLYDPALMLLLARCHGIVPPTRFGDDAEPYYPTNSAPAKAKLRTEFARLAEVDAPRAEEWNAAAETV